MDSELRDQRDVTVSESFDTAGRDGGYHIAARPKSFTEQFERVCPYYMAWGMTYEQFWDGDNEMPRMYREAHKIKLQEQDQYAWLQGAYVYHAVGSLAPVLKAFAKGGAKPYLERPLGYGEEVKADKANAKSKEEKSDEKARTWMEMWAINFNEKFDKKGGDANERNCAGD